MSDDDPARTSEEKDERLRLQRRRSIAIAWALIVLAVLFFVVTIVRMGPSVLERPL